MVDIYKKLIWGTTLLALTVVVLGAYVRLSDAGLGCPDWPGCYGHLGVPQTADQMESAKQLYPHLQVEKPKAAKEMLHRYVAGTLGLLILLITIMSFSRIKDSNNNKKVTLALLGLVIFQSLLGMWTVTLLLKPVIVTAHLLGGMAVWALLVWLSITQLNLSKVISNLHRWATAALVILVLQIALGGWVSSNYAALACSDFPLCNGQWVPAMDFSSAFHLTRDLGKASDGGYLSSIALTTVHWSHRLGALITLVVLGIFGLRATRNPGLRLMGYAVLALLLTQISLGVANVWLSLPLPIALLHNAVAALLLAAVVMLKFKIVN